ncbi:unnamed protein product [Paramecium sonneborni]|uniref:RING-type E3 ubiquitin transferase n=1 Tax=Paramecium sonneborni TaxID=65129 RepID=A0A8S1KIV2_9CILI|nr:unnamed protein product [Paramecium sonneborni]
MNQQQIIIQSLKQIRRNYKIDLLFKYLEVIIYSISICFIQKDIKLYKFYQSSLFVFIQGIALNHYYLYIVYKHQKKVEYFGYNWHEPFSRLQSFHPNQLRNSILFYHTNFLILKSANLVFEIFLFLSTPYELYQYLQLHPKSYSKIIVLEVLLYFIRRFYAYVFPFFGFCKCCCLCFRFRRYDQITLQNQISIIKNKSIQLEEKTCPKSDLECIICQEKIIDKYILLPCDHYYHKECIDNWFIQKQTCPICRTSIN